MKLGKNYALVPNFDIELLWPKHNSAHKLLVCIDKPR